jgi:hypothetical protein
LSHQLVCDKCGQAIDQSKPYFSVTITKMQIPPAPVSGTPAAPVTPGVLTAVEATKTYDFHDNHAPKIIDAPATPATPANTPK